ncbi:MAG: hypothetical protein LBM93_12170 [Oscillospiraceae bacterium]|nr:hypothetical protein [Oscillospiraceae bacterium]
MSREDFLVSEEKFSRTHYAWYQNYETGNEYDWAFWREIDSNMVYINGFWWFIDNGNLCRYNFTENVIEEMKYISENAASLAYINGKIYYNNIAENSVYGYDLSTGENVKISIELNKNGTVWGLAEQYGELILTIKSSFYAVDTYYRLNTDLGAVFPYDYKILATTKCDTYDTDRNGSVNIADIVFVQKIINNRQYSNCADFDNNRVVNVIDSAMIKKALFQM